MIVVFFGASGLTNAYRSVASYCGMPLISGASRWLEATAPEGANPTAPAPAISAPLARVATARRRRRRPALVVAVSIGPPIQNGQPHGVRYTCPSEARRRRIADFDGGYAGSLTSNTGSLVGCGEPPAGSTVIPNAVVPVGMFKTSLPVVPCDTRSRDVAPVSPIAHN